MPQAMPMNWLMLYNLFIIIFILIIVKLYFINNKNPALMKIEKKINKTNWKW